MAYLCIHFGAVIAYSYPYKNPAKLKYYVFPYIYPYFHQDWSMFAPIPTQNFSIYLRYELHGERTDWHNVFYETLSNHQANRFGGNEAIQLAYSNALRFYSSSISEKSTIETDDHSNLYFFILKKIIVNKIRDEKGVVPEKVEVIIGINDKPKNFIHYHYYKLKN